MIKITVDKRQFRKDMQVFQKTVQNAFESSFDEGGREMEANAKILSSDTPTISNSIQLVKIPYGFDMTTGNGMEHKEYTAYREFGTGNYAAVLVPNLPQDLQDLARKYFVNGKGTLPAQPYLYPAFLRFKQGIDQVIVSRINGTS